MVVRATKIALLAGISGLALHIAAPQAFAADMAMKAPAIALPPPSPGVWTWYFEGGASDTGGDPFVPGFNAPPFDLMSKRWGWQAGGGVDYKSPNSPWHASVDFRYMLADSNAANSIETATFATGGVISGPNSATRGEHNWESDFMVGRDFGVGYTGQWKFGVRVADIWGQTVGSVAFASTALVSPPSSTQGYVQTNHFVGAGPRGAVEGSIPLQGGFSIDYNGGIAGLFGHSSGIQNVTIIASSTPAPGACLSGCPLGISSSENLFVFNADGQVGLGYAFSKDTKLSVNYRYEGYWNALRGFNAAGSAVNLDRTYSGPTVKLTVAY